MIKISEITIIHKDENGNELVKINMQGLECDTAKEAIELVTFEVNESKKETK